MAGACPRCRGTTRDLCGLHDDRHPLDPGLEEQTDLVRKTRQRRGRRRAPDTLIVDQVPTILRTRADFAFTRIVMDNPPMPLVNLP